MEGDPTSFEEAEEERDDIDYVQLNLVDFVAKPTWKEFLLELVNSEKLNPWEVDLVEVAEKYLNAVKALQSMDLRIPANVILAASLLLRFKSDALKLEDEKLDFEEVSEEPFVPINEEIPDLVRRGIIRKRKMTLDELIEAIDKVIGDDNFKPVVPQKHAKVLNIALPEQDLHDIIKKVHEKILVKKDKANVLLFSDMMEEISVDEFIFYFIPLLHLINEHKVFAWQDGYFGKIFIKVVDCKAGELKEAVQQEPELEAVRKKKAQ